MREHARLVSCTAAARPHQLTSAAAQVFVHCQLFFDSCTPRKLRAHLPWACSVYILVRPRPPLLALVPSGPGGRLHCVPAACLYCIGQGVLHLRSFCSPPAEEAAQDLSGTAAAQLLCSHQAPQSVSELLCSIANG